VTTRYVLPSLTGPDPSRYWEGGPVYTLADGTLLLGLSDDGIASTPDLAIWNPTAASLTQFRPSPYISPGIIARSGDGKRVYSIGYTSPAQSYYYDVLTKTFSGSINIGGMALNAAVNFDGSRVAVFNEYGCKLFDNGLNALRPFLCGAMGFVYGGMIFGRNGLLYEESQPVNNPVLFTINPDTGGTLNVAPALAIPAGNDIPSVGYPVPLGVDSTGVVIGGVANGITFDDATFTQNLSPLTPPTPPFLDHMSPQVGPLAGGTISGGFGNALNLTPDVWYGPNRGAAQIVNGNTLQLISPAGNAPGPVNVKMIFPDGMEIFDPLFFSYGPFVQANVFSGSSPGGVLPVRLRDTDFRTTAAEERFRSAAQPRSI
jgi:hypothetical protein